MYACMPCAQLGVYIIKAFLCGSCFVSLSCMSIVGGLSACMYVCSWLWVCVCVCPAGWAYFSVDRSSVLHHHITLETASSFFPWAENNKGPRSFSSLLSFNGRGNLSFCCWFSSTCSPTSNYKALNKSLPDTPAPNDNSISSTQTHRLTHSSFIFISHLYI